MSESAVSKKSYLVVFAALLVLTVVTVLAAYIDLGTFSTVVALGIAGVKAFLVFTYFMHLRYSEGTTRLAAAGGLFWLLHNYPTLRA